MTSSIQERRGKFQLRTRHKLLPRDFFFTFVERAAAESYRDQLEALLARGIVPAEMLAAPARGENPKLVDLIDAYKETQPVTDSDAELLDLIAKEAVGLRVSGVTFAWAEKYVRELKVSRNLAPGTIRKRIGALARVLDWHWLRVADKDPDNGSVRANPLRLLPDGYSLYRKTDLAAVRAAGGERKEDVSRDRRLTPAEEARVRRALAGEKREDRERPLPADADLSMLFDLIIDTGLRLREAYRLRLDQFDLGCGILHVEGSKGRRGVLKPRVVPLKRELRDRLRRWLKGRKEGLVFPLWDGDPESLDRTSARLSSRFSTLFAYAGVEDFTEHDLRHEATCRWFELKKPKGGWVFSDLEICKIMGWTSTKMALRYLSLRGEDLADRLL